MWNPFKSTKRHKHRDVKVPKTTKVPYGTNCSIGKTQNNPGCKSRPKPLVPYFGGKARVADKIIKTFPKHKTYVEPFVGGGSVYWADTQADKYVINDLNKDIYNLYKTAKNSPNTLKKCDVNRLNTKSKFDSVKHKSKKSACDTINLQKHSFSGTGIFAKKDHKFNNNFNGNHSEKLKKTRITNQDFRKVIKSNDKKETLIYLDPPYVVGGKTYKTHGVTPKDVCDSVKKLKKAKVSISYDVHKDVKKSCKGLKFHHIKLPYSAGKTRYMKTEYLITNY